MSMSVNPGDSLARRQFLKLSVAAVSGLALTGCRRQAPAANPAGQLNIYSWADYLHPNTIPEFQRRFGVEVTYDTFASNEALLAKLQAGASGYDVVVPTSYMVQHLRELRLLLPLDHERIPNFKHVMKRFQNPSFDPNCQVSIPYTWGTTGIGYSRSAFGPRKVTDWDVFWWKPMAQRITLLDDERETIGMALKHRGHSYNETDPILLQSAAADLIDEKPLVMCYTSDQVIVHLASGDSLCSLVFSGDCYQAARQNPDVAYVLPHSGASLWSDNLCIPAGAENVDNAYLWLNFMQEPEVATANANYTRYATPNSEAFKQIRPELLSDSNLYPTDAVMDRLDEIMEIGSAMLVYDRLWTELKCV